MNFYSNFDAVIFDFDGVLLDSEPIHYQSYKVILKNFDIDFDYSTYISRYLGLSDSELFPTIFNDYKINIEERILNELISNKVLIYEETLRKNKNIHFNDGCEELLKYISSNSKKIAICSGSTKFEINAALNFIDDGVLKKYFNHIVSIDEIKEGKPSPLGYLETSKLLKVPSNKCIVIEDSPTGIKAAKSAGMYVVGITTTYNNDKLNNADKIISSLTDLIY